MVIEKKIMSNSEDETLSFGRKIGERCNGGDIILLKGPLGAGKSVMARGIARGLGVTGTVRSPSFNLMREYNGRLVFRHWDLYRLDSGFRELGILESTGDNSVVAVEWAERWPELDNHATTTVELNYGETETARIINYTGPEFN